MALRCPTCERTVSEGTFCPFDGNRLIDPDAEQDADDPLVGQILGQRYQLEHRIGSGGMGTVYRARHVLMEKPVAVKVLRPELANDGYAAGRFKREARSACRIEHESCVAVTDFGQEANGTHFLVMEYLEGRTLWQLLRESGPLPWPRAVELAIQVARALTAAHQQGVVHRDLKPENVMLVRREDRREVVKVLDFGLAKVVQSSEENAITALTRHGMIFGTPRYMSPEQIEGRETDPRADLYSFGVMLYEMVTGLLPFEDRSVVALLNKHVHEQPVPPSRRLPELELPVRLEQLILALIAKRSEDRPAQARDVAATLEEIGGTARIGARVGSAAEAAVDGVPDERSGVPGRRRVPSWLLPAMGGAMAATVLTVLMLWLTGRLPLPGSAAEGTARPVPAVGSVGAAEAVEAAQARSTGVAVVGSGSRDRPVPRGEVPAGSAAPQAPAPPSPADAPPAPTPPAAAAPPAPVSPPAAAPPAPAPPAAPPPRPPRMSGGGQAAAPGPGAGRPAPAPAPATATAPARAQTPVSAPAEAEPGRAPGSTQPTAPAPAALTIPPQPPGTVEPLAAALAVTPAPAPAAEAPARGATTEQLLQAAREAIGRRHYEVAGKLLQKALSDAPGNPLVHTALANLHFERGRFDAALRSARRAAELNPAGVAELMLLGQIAYKIGDRQLACRSFAEVLRLQPGHERAQRYRSKVGCP